MKRPANLSLCTRGDLQTHSLTSLKANAPGCQPPNLEQMRAEQAAQLDWLEERALHLAFAEDKPPQPRQTLLKGLDTLLQLYRRRAELSGRHPDRLVNEPLRGRTFSLAELVTRTLAATA